MSINENNYETSNKRLIITIILNFLVTIVQIIGGIISGSLALISDAMHNFSDGVAVIITYIAIHLSRRPKTIKYTFGLKRAEIIAAILNSSTLIIISFFLIKEAIERLKSPEPISGNLMLIVAIFGLIANIVGTILLKKGSKTNLNIRAAYFHLLSDVFSSIAVIVGAIFIIFYKIYWLDPILTILISLYILKETYKIVKESIDILMMSNPEEIDLHEIKEIVEKIPGVHNIHHMHLWKLNDVEKHFEAHVEIEDMFVSKTINIQNSIESELKNRYSINHITLQFECDRCEGKKIL